MHGRSYRYRHRCSEEWMLEAFARTNRLLEVRQPPAAHPPWSGTAGRTASLGGAKLGQTGPTQVRPLSAPQDVNRISVRVHNGCPTSQSGSTRQVTPTSQLGTRQGHAACPTDLDRGHLLRYLTAIRLNPSLMGMHARCVLWRAVPALAVGARKAPNTD